MLDKILGFSVRQRAFVLLLTCVLVTAGTWSAFQLHVDAVPDITSVQVQVNTAVPALAPEEIEHLVTFPIESRMSGMPGLVELRSLSRPGLSQVTMTFTDGADVYRLRQLAMERLQEAADELPRGVRPTLAPISTGLSNIFYYAVSYGEAATGAPADEYERLLELSLIQEYTIKPLLRNTPGLAEVNTSGGYRKEIVVRPNPARLNQLGLTFEEFAGRIRGSFENVGGGLLEVGGEQVIIRSNARLTQIDEIAKLPVKFAARADPILVEEVAEVEIGSSIRTGAATRNGEEAVIGGAIMLAGENSRLVARAVRERLQEIEERLPEGVEIAPLYDRSDLIDATIATVRRNLTHGAALVVIILFLMLGNVRAALIVASVIPLSMLVAFIGMTATGVSGNLMSLGAIDFGLIVSGAVIVVENCVRRLDVLSRDLGREPDQEERRREVLAASREVAGPMFFGVAVITLVYVPILALSGVEGKMFHPMAVTVMFALGGSLMLALTYAPALSSWLPARKAGRQESLALRLLVRGYRPVLHFAMRFPAGVAVAASLLFALSVFTFARMGAEFIPQLQEGSLLVQMVRSNSVGIETSLDLQRRAERVLLREIPEIRHTFSHIGTAEIATDPMGPNISDTYISFHPPGTWRQIDGRRATKEDLVREMQRVLDARVPGQFVLFTQPIQLRFNEMMAGARADIAVKIFGEDLEELETQAFAVRDVLRDIPGGGDVEFDAIGRVPMLEIVPRREAMRRLNIHPHELNTTIEAALAGEDAGLLIEGNRRFPVVVRMSEELRHDFDAIRDLPVRTDDGGLVRLGQVADLRVEDRIGNITREMASRRAAILINLRGRDTQSFVAEAEARLRDELELPAGYAIAFGGQFENLRRAQSRLAVLVPLALGLIFFLIFSSTGSFRQALVIFTAVPFAVTGGVFALWLREMPFSIPAGVGFIALSGIAVMDALVLVNCFNDLRRRGVPLPEAVRNGAMMRLRPVLMTSLVAGLGFLPMAIATTLGAEVQRPLATVVIGGIISSTLLTLLVLPGLYSLTERRRERAGADSGELLGNRKPVEPLKRGGLAVAPHFHSSHEQ